MNCLVPEDPEIRVTAQNRNYEQSVYQLDYMQDGVPSRPLSLNGSPKAGMVRCFRDLLLARLAFLLAEAARA